LGANVLVDWERGPIERPEEYIREAYGLDISGRYGGRVIKNPFGKASGQLSLHLKQVQADADAGLGFVVLKTVIAQDESGEQMMKEWAIKETRMQVEPIAGKTVARLGWNVTWKGRGWHESFDSYLAFTRESLQIGLAAGMVVAPSVKYHLPGPGETTWKTSEYSYTTRALSRAWQEAGESGPLILEKDFSPTLAGDDRSTQQAKILEWLQTVPGLVKSAAPAVLGMKLMNATFEDGFQLEMLKVAAGSGVDFLTCFNRLFDPQREFEGKVGVAYGGPDLSAWNLRVLRLSREAGLTLPPLSATGDVCSGQMALRYALLGAESLQMHTLFQLPDIYYGVRGGSKSARALHFLLFHPQTGLVPAMLALKERTGVSRFLDLQHLPEEALA
jgi:dihydroorotate dehydrogenase